MAAIPAEPSRPSRSWRGSVGAGDDAFWSAVVAIAFAVALYWFAYSILALARISASADHESVQDLISPISGCAVSLLLILGPLVAYGRRPRTLSNAASASFGLMKALMLLAGVLLFLGGALQLVETNEFIEQAALAVTALLYILTPISLHLSRR